MLWRICPFVGFWRSYLWMYVDLMTCILWRCMTFIRCNCWGILYMHAVWIIVWRRSVYFLNICFIRVFYRFNRNRVLQWLLWRFLLGVDKILWYYSVTMFWKINYACFGIIEEVASKSLYNCIICVIYPFKDLGCYSPR